MDPAPSCRWSRGFRGDLPCFLLLRKDFPVCKSAPAPHIIWGWCRFSVVVGTGDAVQGTLSIRGEREGGEERGRLGCSQPVPPAHGLGCQWGAACITCRRRWHGGRNQAVPGGGGRGLHAGCTTQRGDSGAYGARRLLGVHPRGPWC